MTEELVELLVARTFANKQETLGAETRVRKTYGDTGTKSDDPKGGFLGSWQRPIPASWDSGISHPAGHRSTLQRHLKQASSPFAQEL